MVLLLIESHLSLSLRVWVYDSQTLAHMLDSLVRVSRRVNPLHFASRLSNTVHSRTLTRVAASLALVLLHVVEDYNSTPKRYLPFLVAFCKTRQSDADLRAPLATKRAIHWMRIASLLTISGPFSLSFQSSFHLSITLLVRYRSLAVI